jgi:hypothetical protein
LIEGAFWYYAGAKWRSSTRYYPPAYRTIVEPFAGAAGYSLRYCDHDVVLVEKFPIVAEMWRYLIAVPATEVLRIPCVDAVDDLPAWVPQGARYLIGFRMNHGCDAPRKSVSAGVKRLRANGRVFVGWNEAVRARVARQVEMIRHWRIIEGDYTTAPDLEATWFIDPPYQHATRCYVHGPQGIDFPALGRWCRERRGQMQVCEQEGADWLPFRPLARAQSQHRGTFGEAIWTNYRPRTGSR